MFNFTLHKILMILESFVHKYVIHVSEWYTFSLYFASLLFHRTSTFCIHTCSLSIVGDALTIAPAPRWQTSECSRPFVKWICQRAFYMRFDLLPWRFILHLTHRPIDSSCHNILIHGHHPIVMYCSEFTLCVFGYRMQSNLNTRYLNTKHS